MDRKDMNQTEARQLAREFRESKRVAIATQLSRYQGRFPEPEEPWIVVVDGTIIHGRDELAGGF